MKKFYLSGAALAIITLVGCNDGSGFVSNKTQQQSTVPTQETALRNMVSDSGAEISAIDADSPAGEQIEKLIDGQYSTKFLTFSSQGQFVFKAVQPYVLKGYNLVSANDQPKRDPKYWLLEVSNDGQSWQTLDEQFDNSFTARGQLKQFKLTENEQAFQYYRFTLTHGGTDDYGADILQLAELELIVKAEAPIVAFSASTTTPEVNEIVIFKDESLAGATSWQWTFEDATPTTSQEASPLVRFNSLGAKSVTLVASNDKGSSELTKASFIRVIDKNDPWAGFNPPTVSFVKQLPEHPGQLELERVLPELDREIQQICLSVAKILYSHVSQSKVFNSVQFETGQYDFPAAKSGTDSDMILLFDLDHLYNAAQQGDEALKQEVLGVLWHELTHGYNHVPDKGVYQAGNELHSYLEGLANLVRIKGGYLEHYRQNIKWIDSWNEDAYNQTSFFLEWVANTNRNTDFIRQFNHSALVIKEWSFDKAFKSIFGDARGINEVFGEYQAYLEHSLGIKPPYPTPLAGYTNALQETQVSITTNATHIGIWGEGPDMVGDNNINTKFNAIIEQPWWVSQYAPDLLPINQVDAVELLFAFSQPVTIGAYSLTTGNDNPQRDPSSWQLMGSDDGALWTALSNANYPSDPARLSTHHILLTNEVQYQYYKLVMKNEQQGENIGGDNGRLIQLGEVALLSPSTR